MTETKLIFEAGKFYRTRIAELERELELSRACERMMCKVAEEVALQCGLDVEKAEPPDVVEAVIALRADYDRLTEECAMLIADRSTLRAQLAEAKRDWLPISEAPKDGTELLLGWWEEWPQRKWKEEVAPAGNIDTAIRGSGYLHGRATHFQPLPEPPKQ